MLLSAFLVGAHGLTGRHDAAAATSTTSVAPPVTVPAGPMVVEVVMDEFSYRPRRVQVPAGVPVVLEVVNVGKVDHEIVIGDEHVQDEAEAAMADGGHAHDGDVPALDLRPGERGTIEATFQEPGTLLLGCHVPGHWAAGMKGFLDVG